MTRYFSKRSFLLVLIAVALALSVSVANSAVIKTYDWTHSLTDDWNVADSGPGVGCGFYINSWTPPMLAWHATWQYGWANMQTNAGLSIAGYSNVTIDYSTLASVAGNYGVNFRDALSGSFNGTDWFPIFVNNGIPVTSNFAYTYDGTPLVVNGGGAGGAADGGAFTRAFTLSDAVIAGHDTLWLQLALNNDSIYQPLDAFNQNSTLFTPITVTGNPVPEPGSILLAMSGIGLVGILRKSYRSK